MQYFYIFIGGAFGALLRYLFSFFNHGHDIPIGTLSANLIGGFFMGFLSALTIKLFNNNPLLREVIEDYTVLRGFKHYYIENGAFSGALGSLYL